MLTSESTPLSISKASFGPCLEPQNLQSRANRRKFRLLSHLALTFLVLDSPLRSTVRPTSTSDYVHPSRRCYCIATRQNRLYVNQNIDGLEISNDTKCMTTETPNCYQNGGSNRIRGRFSSKWRYILSQTSSLIYSPCRKLRIWPVFGITRDVHAPGGRIISRNWRPDIAIANK